MQTTTDADRKAELRGLLDKVAAHPERSWSAERERIAVLQRMMGAKEKVRAG